MDGVGVASEVGIAVWNVFHREGIEIPFPQRVLHGAQSQPGSADRQ
jgi:small-conductance mechanosensitive channel